jgi:hypothetical protein
MNGQPRIKKWIRSAYTGKLVPLYERNPYRLYPGMDDHRKITFEPESGIEKETIGPKLRRILKTSY